MAEITLDKLPQRTRDLFNKGFGAFERGNIEYAIDLLTACVEQEPAFLQARKFLRAAEVQQSRQKKAGAISHLISSVTSLPAYGKVMAMIQTGKASQALIEAEKLLRIDPLNLRFVRLFSQAAEAAALPEVAAQTLEVAREHYPEDAWVLGTLGAAYQKIGKQRAARECFEELCRLRPLDPLANKALKNATALESITTDGWSEAAEKGRTYRGMIRDSKEAALLEQESKAVKTEKDTDALIAETLGKIEQDPANVGNYRSLARFYGMKQQFDEAIGALQKAIDLSPGDPEVDNALSATKVEKYDYEIAQRAAAGDAAGAASMLADRKQFVASDLEQRVKRYPNDLNLRHEWGVVLFAQQDRLNEAIQQFQLAQRSVKYRIQTLYYLALCFRKKKQYDLALEQLTKAGAELTGMDETKKRVFYEAGEICELLGQKEKAAEYYKQIYQVDIGYRDIAEKVERGYRGPPPPRPHA